jgi:hypothetical protein
MMMLLEQSTAEGELLATGKTHDDYSYSCVLIDFHLACYAHVVLSFQASHL